MGGVGIFLSFSVGLIAYLFLFHDIAPSKIISVFIAGTLVFGWGLLDDILELPAIFKLIVQLLAVFIVVTFGYRFTQICNWTLPIWFSYILTFGWVLGLINAYNLIDGLDGLCGSLTFTALLTMGACLAFSHEPIYVVYFILCASIFGFLIFNWNPAKIFMGDCGSQFLGFMIAVLPLTAKSNDFDYNKFLMMIILSSIPILDTIAAIWRRLRDHRPIMSADRMHLHHKLLNLGLNKVESLSIILVIQATLCIAVFFTIFIPRFNGTVALLISALFIITMFSILHYIHRGALRRKGAYGQAVVNFKSESKENE